MKLNRIGLSIILLMAGCDAAQIDRICEPSLERQYNVVYNAHFKGEFTINNTCADTAVVQSTDTEPDTLLPGASRTYTLSQRQQYLVVLTCEDSTLTYTYFNQCPK